MPACLNCSHALPPDARFCPGCGQKSATRRLTLRDISHDAWHALTHTDHSVLALVRAMFLVHETSRQRTLLNDLYPRRAGA